MNKQNPILCNTNSFMNREEMRFIVSPNKKYAQWRHYLDLYDYKEWIDCSGMTDAEFDEFMLKGN